MYDFLIIGQGIAGSILAYHLIKNGKKVFIIDDSPPTFFSKTVQKVGGSAKNSFLLKYSDNFYSGIKRVLGTAFKPKVIGGLITPITGKRFSKTWLADELLPYTANFYNQLQLELNVSFYKSAKIVRIFTSAIQANDWSVKSVNPSLNGLVDTDYKFENNQVNYPHGYTVYKQAAVIDGTNMIYALHRYFNDLGIIENSVSNPADFKYNNHYIQLEKIKAKAVIFCEGWKAINNPFFNWLPFMPAKGELLIIKSSGLKLKEIINRGIFVRPLFNDIYLVGSTYTWNDYSLSVTQNARDELCDKLSTLIKTNFTIIEQLAGIRPTVKGRRPFIGCHPQHKNMFIFNGLGTKGLLLAPYFSNHFCDYLLKNKTLMAEIDIKRFYKLIN